MKNQFSAKALLWKAWLIAGILALVGVTVALAASGDLDPTFSGDGKLQMDFAVGQTSRAWDVAIQPDGKIITAGETDPSSTNRNVALARFTKAGVLDATFNGTGKKVVDLGGIDFGYALVLEPVTNKIIVAGQKCSTATCDVAVMRFNPYGTLDASFNLTGKRIDDFGGGDNGSLGAVALQSDGKIVVGGYMFNKATSNYDLAVYRYTKAGALDITFAGTGKKAIAVSSGRNEYGYGIAVQPVDGRIVLIGSSCDLSDANCNFVLVRLNPNGSLDPTFGTGGKQITDFGANDRAYDIALQPNGKMIVAGRKQVGTATYFALARYNPNGTLDATFAGTGKKIVYIAGSAASAQAVRYLPSSGKILACGFSPQGMTLVRLSSAGALDSTFHGTGFVTVNNGGDASCFGLAVQPSDGRYILAGASTADDVLWHWFVARILP